MQHLGQLVKEWRALSKVLRKQYAESESQDPASKPIVEPEWRFGTITQTGFSAGINPTDFQAIAKKLMAMYQATAQHQPTPTQPNSIPAQVNPNPTNPAQPNPTTTTEAGVSTQNHASTTESKYGDGKVSGPSGVLGGSPLGRIVRVQEWHLEDVSYEGGFRMRQARLESSLPQLPSGSGISGNSVTEFIQKQRVAWTDMRVLQRKYDARFSLKCERGVSQSSIANLTPDQRRMQTRRSFWIENYLRIDLSIVQQQSLNQHHHNHNHNNNNATSPSVRWEIEMEIVPEGASQLSDQQLVGHMWNWALEILDSFGKIKGSETVDGPLLVLRLKPDTNAETTQNVRAICTDVLLVPVTRDICRNNNNNQ